MFRPIAQAKTADSVIRQIELLILDGVLTPGDRLPGERDLAQRLDVSRPVLRDALASLEERGLIVARRGGGTFVANILGTVFEEPMVELVRRHPSALFDYLEFRRDIEGKASAYAAERATLADKRILERTFEQMLFAHEKENPDEEARLDVAFHTAIMEAAHNIVLMHMMRSCYRLIAEGVVQNRARLYDNKAWRDSLVEQHRAIVEAILEGQSDEAMMAAVDHVRFIETALRLSDQTAAWEEVSELKLKRLERDKAFQPQ